MPVRAFGHLDVPDLFVQAKRLWRHAQHRAGFSHEEHIIITVGGLPHLIEPPK